MIWLQALPAYLAAAALVVLPGVPLAAVLRLRGLGFLAGSIAASFALITGASLIAPFLSLSWSALLPLGLGAVFAATVAPFANRMAFRPREGLFASLRWPVIAVTLGAVLVGTLVRSGMGAPDAISQSYDNVFHLNLVQFILDGGSASPLHMTLSTPEAAQQFYPNTWHAVAALIVQLTGASVELATGAMIVVTSCLVWTVAMLFFAAPLVGDRPRHLMSAVIVASGFTAFPYMLLTWGVLYPNVLSTALIPIALGFVHALLRRDRFHETISPFAGWLGTLGALGAATAAHPNALFGAAALAVPIVIASVPAILRTPSGTASRALRVVAIALPFVAVGLLWGLLSTSDNGRVFEQSVPKALISALTNAPLLDQRSWVLTLLVVAGVLLCAITPGHRWLIGSYAIAVALYTIASGVEGPLRTSITGLWYNDAHRLAALIPVVAVPLAAIALARLSDLVVAGKSAPELSRFSSRATNLVAAGALVLLLAVVAFALRGNAMTAMVGQMRALHTIDEESRLISTNEIRLMEEAAEILPEDAVIAGNPWNGSALAFTFAHRDVVFPHMGGDYGPDSLVIAQDLKDGTPAACDAANRLGVTHVLDMGELYSVRGKAQRHLNYPGLTDVDGSPVLTPVLREGDAVLYELSGCAD